MSRGRGGFGEERPVPRPSITVPRIGIQQNPQSPVVDVPTGSDGMLPARSRSTLKSWSDTAPIICGFKQGRTAFLDFSHWQAGFQSLFIVLN
jgi:hypothetical protein